MLFKSKTEFKNVFLAYYTPLCNYVNNKLNNISNAEDIVQDVFLHLWEKNDSLHFQGSIDQYLFKSVKNKIFEFLRSNNSYEKHKAQLIHKRLEDENIEELSDSYMKLERINSSLRHLPPKCKNVFVLHKFKGLTYAEIAEGESISIKTVENHMLKAIKILRSHLKD